MLGFRLPVRLSGCNQHVVGKVDSVENLRDVGVNVFRHDFHQLVLTLLVRLQLSHTWSDKIISGFSFLALRFLTKQPRLHKIIFLLFWDLVL